jgi:16S rRNA (adenine1518-N6/adenine1519-N6)-dimethyltransferase
MSFHDAKYLLREHQIVPNKLLGQNFMIDSSIFPKLSTYASLNHNDVVLDAGAGFGLLTRFMTDKCKAVVAVEKDPKVAKVLCEQVKGLTNVTVIKGDVLRVEVPFFNKTVCLPPYYLSSHLVIWLIERKFECAVLVVQKEFANRLDASVGSEEYGWLKVVTHSYAEAELLDDVPKWMFQPEPGVDSIIVRLKPWVVAPFTLKDASLFRRLVQWLFTQRNKKLDNAVSPFIRNERKVDKSEAEKIAQDIPFRDRRVRDLSPIEFGEIANGLVI